MQPCELVAREKIRDTLARYNWAGDAGRTEDLAATFCPDGELEIRGTRTCAAAPRSRVFSAASRPVLAASAGGHIKPVVRHVVTNVLFTDVTADRAHVSSYFTVLTRIGLDHFGRYRDVLVPDDNGRWLIKHRTVSTDWIAPDSQLAHG